MPQGNPADPWSMNYFDPPTPKVEAPGAFKPKTPKLIPDVDRLFIVQRNTLKVLNALEDAERGMKETPKGWDTLKHEAENAYRVIRSYLNEYANANQVQ